MWYNYNCDNSTDFGDTIMVHGLCEMKDPGCGGGGGGA